MTYCFRGRCPTRRRPTPRPWRPSRNPRWQWRLPGHACFLIPFEDDDIITPATGKSAEVVGPSSKGTDMSVDRFEVGRRPQVESKLKSADTVRQHALYSSHADNNRPGAAMPSLRLLNPRVNPPSDSLGPMPSRKDGHRVPPRASRPFTELVSGQSGRLRLSNHQIRDLPQPCTTGLGRCRS